MTGYGAGIQLESPGLASSIASSLETVAGTKRPRGLRVELSPPVGLREVLGLAIFKLPKP